MSKEEPELTPVRGWQILWRGQFQLVHAGELLVIDVDYFDWNEHIHLFRNGEHLESRASPAKIDVEGMGQVEAAMSTYGMRYARLLPIPDDGISLGGRDSRIPFEPAAGTGERLRANFELAHPGPSRLIAAFSSLVLIVALATQLPHWIDLLGALAENITDNIGALPTIGWSFWTFELPGWVNTILTVAGVIVGIERASRLKYNPLLDD